MYEYKSPNEHLSLRCLTWKKFCENFRVPEQAPDKRFSINRDKSGAEHYRLSEAIRLRHLLMSGAKVSIIFETTKFFPVFFIFHNKKTHFPLVFPISIPSVCLRDAFEIRSGQTEQNVVIQKFDTKLMIPSLHHSCVTA